MENLVTINEILKKAEEKHIDLGKGDPYNRLRYYTKIGWLPHMERKDGKGHYPIWAVNRLALIEKLKAEGISNEEITQILTRRDKIRNIKEFFTSPETRTRVITYASFFLLILVILNEMEIITIGKPKSTIVPRQDLAISGQILDSGTAFVPENRNTVFVKSINLRSTDKVYVTFNNNISPATRFWVEEKITGEGFYLSLDTPVAQSAEFSWWVTN